MNMLFNLRPIWNSNDLYAFGNLFDICNVEMGSLNLLNVKINPYGNMLCPLLITWLPCD